MRNPENFEPEDEAKEVEEAEEKIKEEEPQTFEIGEKKENDIEGLETFIGEVAEKLKKEGVPVDDDCRIDMDAFKDVYPSESVEGNKKTVEEFENKWYGNLSKSEIKQEKLKKEGEQLEMLVTSIFNKFLGSEFITVRSAPYDDIRNKVDNLILEKETGNIVCAFDDVGDSSGYRFAEKERKILERNRKGTSIRYGLNIKEGELALEPRENIPIFCLALSGENIRDGIKKSELSFEKKSDFEKKLFDYFVSTLNSQIKKLKLEGNLNWKIKEQLNSFEEVIKKFDK
ncbi:MAG: hypothetical protein ABH919_01375 [bacterium]